MANHEKNSLFNQNSKSATGTGTDKTKQERRKSAPVLSLSVKQKQNFIVTTPGAQSNGSQNISRNFVAEMLSPQPQIIRRVKMIDENESLKDDEPEPESEQS